MSQMAHEGMVEAVPDLRSAPQMERAVLGAVLANPGAWPEVRELGADDFSLPDYRLVYAAAAELAEEGNAIDRETVAHRLVVGEAAEPPEGWEVFVNEIVATTSGVNAGQYAAALLDLALRRRIRAAYIAGARATLTREPIESFRERVDEVFVDADRYRPASAWETCTAGDLLDADDADVEWIVQDLLPAGATSLLLGSPKSGKSSMARILASRVALGAPWLSRRTSPGAVVYVALDERRATVRQHVQQILVARPDVDARKLRERLHLAFAPRPLRPVEALEAALHAIADPVLVIVDTLMKWLPEFDSDSYGETGTAMQAVTELAHRLNVHVLMLHHARKDSSGDLTTAALGSTRLAADVDVVGRVAVRDGKRFVAWTGRDGVDVPETEITFSDQAPAAPGGNPYAG